MNKLSYLNSIFIFILCILGAENSFALTPVSPNSRQLTVVIDPGHGGKDPGAVNKTIREKDVVLGIGIQLGKLINESYPEVKVIYTRKTDVFIPLIERSRIANRNKADLFISLHANACGTPSVRGTETFLLGPSLTNENLEVAKKENSVILLEEDYSTTYEGFDPNSPESYIMFEMAQSIHLDQSLYFADAIQQQFRSRISSPDRGVKQAGFLVLRQSSMPSVLVEAGFLSNQAEANYLNSENGQHQVALSVFEAFRKFRNKSFGLVNAKRTEIIASPTILQKEVENEDQKPGSKHEVVVKTVYADNTATEKANTTGSADAVNTTDLVYYSVQIGANKTPMEPGAANFKGLKNVRREKNDQYYRYYVGKEESIENIRSTHSQIKKKYPEAFIVSFVNGNRVALNAGSK